MPRKFSRPADVSTAGNSKSTNARLERITLEYWEYIANEDENSERLLFFKDLAKSLKTNTNLKELTILSSLPEEGKCALWGAIYDDTSMNTIVESNHTCSIHCKTWDFASRSRIDIPYPGLWTQGVRESSPESSLESKLRYALGANQDGPLNVHYLNEIPRGLMPKVIQFVQPVFVTGLDNDTVARISLKNVFELMRNCMAPLL